MQFSNFEKIIDSISQITKEGLPGVEAQALMAPAARLPIDRYDEMIKNGNPKQSAVLSLIYPKNEQLYLVLIERPIYKGTHSGQISFPGGKMETYDKDLIETALRETEEEISVPKNLPKIISPLTKVYIPPSNFLVMPFLAYADEIPKFNPDPNEVAGILEVPVSEFLDKNNLGTGSFTTSNGVKMKYPCFQIGEKIIWGATAMILSEAAEIFKRL